MLTYRNYPHSLFSSFGAMDPLQLHFHTVIKLNCITSNLTSTCILYTCVWSLSVFLRDSSILLSVRTQYFQRKILETLAYSHCQQINSHCPTACRYFRGCIVLALIPQYTHIQRTCISKWKNFIGLKREKKAGKVKGLATDFRLGPMKLGKYQCFI